MGGIGQIADREGRVRLERRPGRVRQSRESEAVPIVPQYDLELDLPLLWDRFVSKLKITLKQCTYRECAVVAKNFGALTLFFQISYNFLEK